MMDYKYFGEYENTLRQVDKEWQLWYKKELRKEKLMQINKSINNEGWLTEEELKDQIDLSSTGLYIITSDNVKSKSEKPENSGFENIDTAPDYFGTILNENEKRN